MKLARSLLSKGPSEYSIVARLVYESAQKSGADLRDQEAVEYTKQLQRMTKKRGSSLGQVSHNIAEFLVAHRDPVELPPKRPLAVSVARPVPMLDIPLRTRTDSKPPKATVPTPPKAPQKQQPLDLKIQMRQPPLSVQEQPANVTASRESTIQEVELSATNTAAAAASYPKRVSVVEDKPLFHSVAAPTDQVAPPIQTITKAAVKPAAAKPVLPKPRLVQQPKPREATPAAATPAAATSVVSALPSIDDWEAQREREIELLREAQRAELEAKEAREREALHKEEGYKWVDLRREPFPFVARDDPFFASNYDLYASRTIESISAAVDAALAVVSFARPLPTYTLILAANKISSFTPLQRESIKDKLVALASQHKNTYALKMLQMENSSSEEFMSMFEDLDAKEIARFPLRIVRKYFCRQIRAKWEVALEKLNTVKPLLADHFCSLELSLLLAANTRSMSIDAKKIVAQSLTERVRGSMHVVGTQHQLAAARLMRSTPWTAAGLAQRGDATENVYADLIRVSRPEGLQALLEQLGQHGMSQQDPLIASAVMDHKIRNKSAGEVYNLIQQQRDAGVPLMGCHLNCAMRAALSLRTHEAAATTLKLIKEAPPSNPLQKWRTMMPLLFELQMNTEIVELYEQYCSIVQSPLVAATSIVPILNSALKSCNQEPLSQSFAEVVSSTKDHASEDVTTITTTEVMLEYAKSRNWESAINLLKTLPTKVNASTMPTLTLQYNCVLSAAVQEPEIVVSVFDQMKKYAVEQNSTTYNTVMSSLSKSDAMWKQALDIFTVIPPSTKDSSSFLVALSILNKHSLWEQSVDVFQRMKATPNMSKPPLVVYELAIGCTHRHSWAATIKLFQECIRLHGPQNVKEIVASRVIRSLESGRRTDDVLRVQKELDKAKKKKKKE